MSYARCLISLSLGLLAGSSWIPAMAQIHQKQALVPLYQPADVVTGLYRHWAPSRAAAFVEETGQLQRTLRAQCASGSKDAARTGDATRTQWRDTVGAWEQLSAVPFGPLIERRSVRQVDFTPTRPKLIKRAIARAPTGAAQMELIGTPAKGLPALEWLLWTQPVKPATPACAYAVEVADDILREAHALREAFDAAATKDWKEEDSGLAFTEFVNQWVGALERLRWQQIERPVRESATGHRSAASFPRAAGNATADSWARQWAGLRKLAVLESSAAPEPGTDIVPLEAYLRGRGHHALADRWVKVIARGDAAMRDLRPAAEAGTDADTDARLLAAASELAAAKRMAEEEIAPALEISIGFSSADGD